MLAKAFVIVCVLVMSYVNLLCAVVVSNCNKDTVMYYVNQAVSTKTNCKRIFPGSINSNSVSKINLDTCAKKYINEYLQYPDVHNIADKIFVLMSPLPQNDLIAQFTKFFLGEQLLCRKWNFEEYNANNKQEMIFSYFYALDEALCHENGNFLEATYKLNFFQRTPRTCLYTENSLDPYTQYGYSISGYEVIGGSSVDCFANCGEELVEDVAWALQNGFKPDYQPKYVIVPRAQGGVCFSLSLDGRTKSPSQRDYTCASNEMCCNQGAHEDYLAGAYCRNDLQNLDLKHKCYGRHSRTKFHVEETIDSHPVLAISKNCYANTFGFHKSVCEIKNQCIFLQNTIVDAAYNSWFGGSSEYLSSIKSSSQSASNIIFVHSRIVVEFFSDSSCNIPFSVQVHDEAPFNADNIKIYTFDGPKYATFSLLQNEHCECDGNHFAGQIANSPFFSCGELCATCIKQSQTFSCSRKSGQESVSECNIVSNQIPNRLEENQICETCENKAATLPEHQETQFGVIPQSCQSKVVNFDHKAAACCECRQYYYANQNYDGITDTMRCIEIPLVALYHSSTNGLMAKMNLQTGHRVLRNSYRNPENIFQINLVQQGFYYDGITQQPCNQNAEDFHFWYLCGGYDKKQTEQFGHFFYSDLQSSVRRIDISSRDLADVSTVAETDIQLAVIEKGKLTKCTICDDGFYNFQCGFDGQGGECTKCLSESTENYYLTHPDITLGCFGWNNSQYAVSDYNEEKCSAVVIDNDIHYYLCLGCGSSLSGTIFTKYKIWHPTLMVQVGLVQHPSSLIQEFEHDDYKQCNQKIPYCPQGFYISTACTDEDPSFTTKQWHVSLLPGEQDVYSAWNYRCCLPCADCSQTLFQTKRAYDYQKCDGTLNYDTQRCVDSCAVGQYLHEADGIESCVSCLKCPF